MREAARAAQRANTRVMWVHAPHLAASADVGTDPLFPCFELFFWKNVKDLQAPLLFNPVTRSPGL